MDEIKNDENQNLIDDHEEATVGMDAINDFDFERAVMLMNVLEKCATIAPKSTSIAGLASAALNEMNEEAKVLAKQRSEAFKQLERKRDEALAAQKAEAEEQARVEAEEAQQVNMHPQPPIAQETPTRSIPRAPAPTPPSENGRRI